MLFGPYFLGIFCRKNQPIRYNVCFGKSAIRKFTKAAWCDMATAQRAAVIFYDLTNRFIAKFSMHTGEETGKGICIEREREREGQKHIYIYTYVSIG